MNTFQAKTICAINEYAKNIELEICDPKKLLWALAGCESSFATDVGKRYESVFDIGGKYWKPKYNAVREMYGESVACSWGVWQIMYTNCYDWGYRNAPFLLTLPEISIRYVIKYINIRCKKAKTLADIGDAYNTGNCSDDNVPEEYIKKLIKCYNEIDINIFKEI